MAYTSNYKEKYAIIIGINQYKNVSNLEFAENDAQEVKDLIIKNFSYKEENVFLFLGKEAKKDCIMNKYTELIRITGEDDSVFIYYAGHGYTEISKIGDVGYLFPYDGDANNLYTLIRWDDFTRNASLIKAKHILYIMDACYSGLAVTRSVCAGSKRFLKDVLTRYSRQVLTAGKANQVFSDGNGPLPNHSIFTGHLIEALNGKAALDEANGIITANSVMAYVYNKVANDTYSQQTPHYGSIDGDGDFVFNTEKIEEIKSTEGTDNDILVTMPTVSITEDVLYSRKIKEEVKELLSDPKNYIKLHDLVNNELRKVINYFTLENFPLYNNANEEHFFENRIKKYEEMISILEDITISICSWGNETHTKLVEKILQKVSNISPAQSGITNLINSMYYPTIILYYEAIIACLDSGNYYMLKKILKLENLEISRYNPDFKNVLTTAVAYISDISKSFAPLTDNDKYYYPFNEYIYKIMQPKLDDMLFLGDSYEHLFLFTEFLIGINYAIDTYKKENGHVWFPLGRYAYKYQERNISKIDRLNIIEELNLYNVLGENKDDFIQKYNEHFSKVSRF